jgi:integrase
LRWADFNAETGILKMAHSVYQTASKGWAAKPTKTHQARRVALDDYAASVLRQHRDRVDVLADQLGLKVREDAFMFSRSPEGSEPIRPNIVTDFTVRMAKKVGVKTHFHELRKA